MRDDNDQAGAAMPLPGATAGRSDDMARTQRCRDHTRIMRLMLQVEIFLKGKNGAPEEIRTPDPQIRSLVLYPAELPALNNIINEL